MTTAVEMLLNDPNELKAMLVAERVRDERLVRIISNRPLWAALRR
jgi:hypothetical protein